jgi:sugar-specific transcriptional regulator TrmB
MKKIIDYLQQLGLSEIEARLYQGLLELGPSTVMELANYTRIKRITSHFGLESLIQQGLITQIRQGARRKVIIEDFSRFKYLIEKKMEGAKQLHKKLPEIIKTINLSYPKYKQMKKIQIRYYEGKEKLRLVYQEILKANRIHSFVNMNKIISTFPENPKLFKEAFQKNKKLEMWEILEDSRSAKDCLNNLNSKYHYCFIPEKMSLSEMDLIIFDNNIAIIHLNITNPTGIIVGSKACARGLLGIHKIVWELLSKKD